MEISQIRERIARGMTPLQIDLFGVCATAAEVAELCCLSTAAATKILTRALAAGEITRQRVQLRHTKYRYVF